MNKKLTSLDLSIVLTNASQRLQVYISQVNAIPLDYNRESKREEASIIFNDVLAFGVSVYENLSYMHWMFHERCPIWAPDILGLISRWLDTTTDFHTRCRSYGDQNMVLGSLSVIDAHIADAFERLHGDRVSKP